MDRQDDSPDSIDSTEASWIGWFCSLPGHDYYLQVPKEFIADNFNIYDLSTTVPYYRQSLDMLLDSEDFSFTETIDPRIIDPCTAMLYGMIHQRYLLTEGGLNAMAERYNRGAFGMCPRYYCSQCYVVPVGRFDEVKKESVRLYCPSCLDIYIPSLSLYKRVDG
ncbi:casein kinase 2 regulatory subunit [Rhizopus stolonifer]|uniref:Casein kinase II subunit beta n=1 Tax=Rhizopus stolonifer TaxID=4846 RepID=A0A367KS11_RHIST|nr:casein kinase 2 regulatory subunit [Rhizopus stolonifer]